MTRVAVTGAAGFIGRRTVECLHEYGADTVEIDRQHGHDVLDADLPALLDGCDVVVHLAGVLGTSELFDAVEHAVDVNVHGTLRVLRACEKSSTSYVGITMPDCWPSVYQATKLAGVRLAEAFHDASAIPVTHVRAFNAYGIGQAHGPGHPQKIVPTFAARAWQRLPIPVWGDGEQTVDLVHVDHVARCLVSAALTQPGGTFDAGSGHEFTVLDVASMVMDVVGYDVPIEHHAMRVGEVPGTRLCAQHPGPVGFDRFRFDRFAAVVDSYR